MTEQAKVNYGAANVPTVGQLTTLPVAPADEATGLDRDELTVVAAIIGQMVDKHSVSHFISVKTTGEREVRVSALADAWLIARAVVKIGRGQA